jgi:hypothetical protein
MKTSNITSEITLIISTFYVDYMHVFEFYDSLLLKV